VHWINPTGAKKVHSLIDKVYQRKNLEMAWEKVRANKGAGGVDGQSVADFELQRDEQLDRLHRELRDDVYRPQPVRQVPIPKAGKPGEWRNLGVPTIFDRVCQQALLNRLEPIFEPEFDDASFGYRRGRSPHGALRKVWREIESGGQWIVDADLRGCKRKQYLARYALIEASERRGGLDGDQDASRASGAPRAPSRIDG
jgi:retron-type reverse transcriptase